MERTNLLKIPRMAIYDPTPTIQPQLLSNVNSESGTDDAADPSTSGTLSLRQQVLNSETTMRCSSLHQIQVSSHQRKSFSPRDASISRRGKSTSCRAPRDNLTQLGRRRPRRHHSLLFPQRLCSLPPVKVFRKAYTNVRNSNSLLGCALMAAEMTALCMSAPAVAAWEPLLQMAHTPLLVADLLLCKGLDVAQRALPCLAQTPQQLAEGLAVCACAAPVGVAYMACKGWLRVVSACVCDVPAVCVGVPAFAACAALECCLCDAPAALCAVPARVTAQAARVAAGDARALVSALRKCSERVLGPLGYEQEEASDDDEIMPNLS